ncbi:MAG: SusC/RagA family TonB-linked outer membrane protein [Prolixibacteraceae bacterium]|nr:SusC/RagA family TonB-linked outer membrane protein [Prolixibacteraceae bacterium]
MKMTVLKYKKGNFLRNVRIIICGTFLTVGSAYAQNVNVKGVVEDETGKIISSVLINTGNKTDTTDIMGQFELDASVGQLITISKSGFLPRKVKAALRLTVTLSPDSRSKNVEMLYENRPAQEITSSVSTLGSKAIAQNSVLAFGNALYGRIPGLNVLQADGEPGDDYPTFFIRGAHSFTGSNAPIVLVDGFERDFNTLTVNEVESVSVLKDAAATALYGMDGANGIILVTTKRGFSNNEKASVEFKLEYGVKTPTRLPKLYGSYDYARFYNMAQKNDGVTNLLYSDTQLEGYRLKTDSMLYPDVNWFDQTIREFSPTKTYTVDFRGGNQVAKYYVTVGMENDEGIFKNANQDLYNANRKLDRINFRSNLDINVTKRLSIRMDLAGRLENVNYPTNSSAAIFNNLFTYHPNTAPIFVAPGVYGGTNTYRNNPVAYLKEAGYGVTHRRLFQSNIIGKYDFSDLVKGLALGIRTTFDNFYTVSDGYTKTYAVTEVLGRNTDGTLNLSAPYGINSNLVSTGPTDNAQKRSNNLEFFGEFKRTFGKHNLEAITMYHQDNYVVSSDFPARRMGVSGKISYGYNQKYFVDLAAQYGASEAFKRGSRFGLFPAISGAWVVSSENFMKNFTPVSYLKLRASTGLVGNQRVGGTRFGYRTLYNTNGTEMPIGNTNLTWEKSFKTDIGLDATLFKEVQLMFNYFSEFRDDILNSGDALMPSYFGNSFGYTNYGQTSSKGFEAGISKSHQSADWGYSIGFNAALIRNKVERMSEVTQEYAYLYKQGLPIGQRFGLVDLGLFQSQDEIDHAPYQSFGKVIPGSIRYQDTNNDKVIDSKDYVAIGQDQSIPEWEMSLNLGFNFKGFYLDANFQGQVGRDVNLRGATYSTAPLYAGKNVTTFVKNPWTPETAATADYPSLTLENAVNNFQNSTYWFRNGDFIRLRTLEVGYNIPKSLISKLKMSAANIYLRGMNVFTLDHLGYFDPEVLEGYPVMKSYNLGVNFKF